MPPRRHKRRNVNRILVVTTVVATLFCAWSTVFSLTHTPDFLKNAVVTVSSPFTHLFDRLGGAVHDVFTPSPDELAYMSRIEQLEAELAAERAKTAHVQQLEEENEQLRDFLGLSEQARALVLLHARRIYSSDTTSRRITLSRGARDDVRVGMPVLDQNGLLGVVSEVAATTCKVTTLLDETVFVGARDARSGVSGTLCGAAAGEKYATFRYLDANVDYLQELRVGDVIVTSGESERYPAGLPIGTIVKVGVDAYDRSPYAQIALYADATAATESVMIVTGEREVEVDTPDPDPDPSETPSEAPEDPMDPDEPVDPAQPTDSTEPTEPTEGAEGDGATEANEDTPPTTEKEGES